MRISIALFLCLLALGCRSQPVKVVAGCTAVGMGMHVANCRGVCYVPSPDNDPRHLGDPVCYWIQSDWGLETHASCLQDTDNDGIMRLSDCDDKNPGVGKCLPLCKEIGVKMTPF